MRLIDADVLKEALRNRISENIDECINNVPTVNVLDEIRAEIKHLLNRFPVTHVIGYDKGFVDGIDKVLQIIDRHIVTKAI